jgi:predicted AAA+ superfamily ATPase
VIAVQDIRLFQNFLGLCATRAGQLLNLNALANECGISQPTAKAWLSALENSYITFQLYPFYENYSKRIVKTPKLYFYDTGLACYLLKIKHPEQIHTHSLKGNLFENMMIAEYVKRINHGNELKDLWFWRDSSGHEIDLMIQDGENLDLLEFKAGQTIMPEMFKELNYFEKLSGIKKITKAIVYGGNNSHNRSDGKVLSWRDV